MEFNNVGDTVVAAGSLRVKGEPMRGNFGGETASIPEQLSFEVKIGSLYGLIGEWLPGDDQLPMFWTYCFLVMVRPVFHHAFPRFRGVVTEPARAVSET
jgi:hypothetical protein